jgi:aminoglycoside 3-N-acetyltransferase
MYDTDSLTADLRALPLPEGVILVVHSGMRSLGPVQGGADAVIAALRAALGPGGTLLAPAFTTQLIDPYTWPVPPPPEERQRRMAEMPTFDPAASPPHRMGAIATALWKTPGALRSHHPVTSWVGLGPRAAELLADQPLDDPEGPKGPVGRAWQADAQILLLGVDHDSNTTIHLAESLLEMPHLLELPDRWPDDSQGDRVWREVRKTTKCSDGFVKLRLPLQRAGVIGAGHVGDAPVQLMRSQDVVAVATRLLAEEPTALLCDDPDCVHCPTSRRVLASWTVIALAATLDSAQGRGRRDDPHGSLPGSDRLATQDRPKPRK